MNALDLLKTPAPIFTQAVDEVLACPTNSNGFKAWLAALDERKPQSGVKTRPTGKETR